MLFFILSFHPQAEVLLADALKSVTAASEKQAECSRDAFQSVAAASEKQAECSRDAIQSVAAASAKQSDNNCETTKYICDTFAGLLKRRLSYDGNSDDENELKPAAYKKQKR